MGPHVHFRAKNPTGRYALNLAVAVDETLAHRLMDAAVAEAAAAAGAAAAGAAGGLWRTRTTSSVPGSGAAGTGTGAAGAGSESAAGAGAAVGRGSAAVASAAAASAAWSNLHKAGGGDGSIGELLPSWRNIRVNGRGLHPSTFRLNVSAFCGIGGAYRGSLGGV